MSLQSIFRRLVVSLLLSSVVGAQAFAQAPTGTPPAGLPIHQEFQSSDNGWYPIGSSGKVSVAASPIVLNSARGALQFDYNVAQGDVAFFGLNVGPGSLAQAKKFRFALRSDYATTVACGLQEKDGGRYMAFFAVPKNEWQIVELAPADFMLAEGPGDPKDPDNKLDLDQVNLVGLVDINQVWAQAGGPALELFGVKTGPHKLYLADLDITAASASTVAATRDMLDSFGHPQVDWLLIGGAQAETYSRANGQGHGLQVKYDQAPAKVSALLRNLHPKQLVGATRVAFSVASTKPATLIVQLEETGGGKYNAKVYVPAGASAPASVSIPFADFKEADDSKDSNHKLDLDQVNHLILIDASGMMGQVTDVTPNTLYIADLHVVR